MLDYIRNLNWAREREMNSYSHWWIGKQVCAGERELDRRGLDPYSWRNSRPPEKCGNDPDDNQA